MEDEARTQERLIADANHQSGMSVAELEELRQRIAELEALEAEYRQAAEALQESESRYKILWDSIGDALFIHDLEGRFLEVNRVACERLGYGREEFLEMTVMDIDAPEFAALVPRRFEELQQSGHCFFETAHVRRDGTVIPIELSCRLIEYAGEAAVLSFARDITERQQAEERIRHSDKKYRDLYEGSRDGSARVTMEGTIVESNSAFRDMLGYTAKELFAKTYEEITPRKWHATEAKILQEQVFERGYSGVYEKEYIRKDGTVFPVELRTYLLKDNEGSPTGMWTFVRDISERKQAERALRESKEQLELLSRLSQRLSESLDLRDVAQRALDDVCIVLGAMRGVLMVHQSASDRLRMVAVSGYDAESVEVLDQRLNLRLGEGLIGWVAMHRQPAIVDDVIRDRRWLPVSGVDDWVRSAMSVPLVSSDELVGVLSIYSDQEAFFQDDHRRLAESAAAVVASAIRNARLYEAERKRASQLAVVNQVSRKAGSILDPAQLLQEIVGAIQQGFKYYNVALFMIDETANELEMLAIAGGFEDVASLGYGQAVGEGMIGWVAEAGQPLLVNDVRQESRYIPGFLDEVLTRSELCVPLKLADRVVGVLDVQDTRLNVFDETDRTAIETLAGQIVVAIENARLYEAVQQELAERRRVEEALRRRMSQLTALSQASQAVTTSLDLGQVLTKVVSLANEMAAADYTSVVLVDEAGQLGRSAENVPGVPAIVYRIREEGLTKWIMQLSQPVIVDEIGEDGAISPDLGKGAPRLANEHIVEAGVKSVAGLPLMVKGNLLGVLFLHSLRPRNFRDQLPLLTAFANQVAIAIENARLYEGVRRRAVHQKALNDVIAAAAAATNLPGLLEAALDRTLQALGLETGGVWLEDFVALRGVPPEMKKNADQIGAAVSMDVPSSWVICDYQQITDGMQQTPVASLMRGLGIQAAMTVPILAEGNQIGWLGVADHAPRVWSAEELALVETVGRQLGGGAERFRLLERIHEQAHQVRQIIQTVPEGMLLLDADSRVVRANPAGQEYLVVLADAGLGDTLVHLGGSPLDELLVSHPRGLWHEVVVDDPPRRVFEVAAQAIESSSSTSGAGTRDETSGWVLAIRDVTREREIQQRVQQQERLAALGQLAAGIAHDFNNIMAVIVLYTQMVLRVPDMLPEIRERLKTVSQQARRATDLIQQILDFSRRAMLKRQPLNLVPFLKEQVKLLERTLPESISISLTFGLGEYLVNADPTRLQQAIMNLALNARDAMPEGGKLHIGLEQMHYRPGEPLPLPEMLPGEWVRLTVTDTGIGIPTDVLPHIFEPFFTTKAPLGSGLGLAQVYGIVRQHEGHIDVTTEVGEGASFMIYLPTLQMVRAEEEAAARTDLAEGHGETVLVVEDDAAARRALREALEVLNYRVLEAANGQEALAVFEQYGDGIALVLSDLVMPEMSGMALLRALRQRSLAVPLVVLTGYPLRGENENLLAQGVADWIQKPVDLEQLAQVVARTLRT